MNIPVIAFFNNKGGVGKTTLVYHLAWSLTDLGKKILAVDLDPQANLTASFLDDDQLETLWMDAPVNHTIHGCLEPLIRGLGDIQKPIPEKIAHNLYLIPGDLSLSGFEDELSQQWPLCLDRKERAFRVISAFWRIMQLGAQSSGAELILVDMGPNLGSINRAALISADYLVVPLTPDLFSIQGLKNIGPTIQRWREEWQNRKEKNPDKEISLPQGKIIPLGYVVMQHAVRNNRPVKAYERWVERIPDVYTKDILNLAPKLSTKETNTIDPNNLGPVKHYRSLIPMSMEAKKPMFHLLPADGAIGSHYHAVNEARENFKKLALEIERRRQKS